MVWSIARKRLLLNLRTFKFGALTLLAFALLLASGFVLTTEYRRRTEEYQARREAEVDRLLYAQAYSQTTLRLDWPPEPLRLLSRGVGDRFGVRAFLPGHFGPMRIINPGEGTSLTSFLGLDFSNVITIVFSLLAILLTYDVIAGEKEKGTLSLLLANSVPRSRVLAGEYLGALLSLMLPLTAGFLLWLILVRADLEVEFDSQIWVRLGLCGFVSLVFISSFILLGLWISSSVSRSATALVLLIVLWVMAGVIYPNFTTWAVTQTHPPEPRTGTNVAQASEASKRGLEMEVINRAIAQAEAAAIWTAVSPWEAYRTVVAILARTDFGSYLRFRRTAEQWQHQLEAWHREKIARYPSRERNWSNTDPDLDLSGMPQAQWVSEPLRESLSRSLPYAGYLLAVNGLLFLAAALAFARYDPRYQL
jgi:ABC-type transport system involved in multi-copper enzyme maturation permease subunit